MKKKTHLNPFLQTFRNASLKSIKEQNNFFWHFVNVLIQDEQCKVRMYSNLKKKKPFLKPAWLLWISYFSIEYNSERLLKMYVNNLPNQLNNVIGR